jgi:hypothetical protein
LHDGVERAGVPLVPAPGLEMRGAGLMSRFQTGMRGKVGIDWKGRPRIMAPGLRGHLDRDMVGDLPTARCRGRSGKLPEPVG